MRWEPINESDLAMRSLLMRMYRSRAEGEAYYHSNLVNGEAAALEADGWIEQHGDGWRMTERGVSEWALLNADNFMHSEWNARNGLFDELREIILEVNAMGTRELCSVEGCDERRMMSKSGNRLTKCEKHQHEYWNERQAARSERLKAAEEAAGIVSNQRGRPPKAKPARRQMDDTHELFLATVAKLPDTKKPIVYGHNPEQQTELKRVIDTYVAPETTNEWSHAPLPDNYPATVGNPCDDCVYKDVVELMVKRGVPGVKEIIEGVKALRK